MYVQRDTEARSCNRCCSGKEINTAYSECVFVAIGIQYVTHAPYCHRWPALLYNILPHFLINGTIFEKKFIERKMFISIFSTTFV
jgi:hypothetical protein